MRASSADDGTAEPTGSCLFCGRLLPRREDRRGRRRVAADPERGRLWEICPHCGRWSPVALDRRWEALEAWEVRIRDEGKVLLRGESLTLLRVGREEVVRVGQPPLGAWGGWRYGSELPIAGPRRGGLTAWLGRLPSPPLEGYDPYGLTGPPGGVGGRGPASPWLASPFLEAAVPLTGLFSALPLASRCPSCAEPLPLAPWAFSELAFRASEGRPGLDPTCAACGDRVWLPLEAVRPVLRLALAVVDRGPAARREGRAAGEALAGLGGRRPLLTGLARIGVRLGELERRDRVALAMALDQEAEAAALEAEWREAEEVAAALDGARLDGPRFEAFRRRVLGQEDG